MTISLRNKRILVTREAKAAQQFADKITAFGGVAILSPLLQINCLAYDDEVQVNVEQKVYDWIFFTSKNGVDCFMKQQVNLADYRIAAVGPKTAQALKEYGYDAAFVPSTYNAEVMAKEFLKAYDDHGPVLFVRGELSSHVLLDAFTKAQRAFHCVDVYTTVTNFREKDKLQEKLQHEVIDFITFTSPSTVDAFMQLTNNNQLIKQIPVVCIGTTTEKRAVEVGFLKTIVPDEFTIAGMLEIIHKELERKR